MAGLSEKGDDDRLSGDKGDGADDGDENASVTHVLRQTVTYVVKLYPAYRIPNTEYRKSEVAGRFGRPAVGPERPIRGKVEEIKQALALVLFLDPVAETGFHEPRGGQLLLSGGYSQIVDVLVLGVTSMTAYPAPLDCVSGGDRDQAEPELEVLDRPSLPPPAAGRPGMDPVLHTLAEVAAVGIEHDPLGAFEGGEPFDGAAERHAIVGRIARREEVFTARPTALLVETLDQAGRAAGSRPIAELIAEARFVRVDENEPGVL